MGARARSDDTAAVPRRGAAAARRPRDRSRSRSDGATTTTAMATTTWAAAGTPTTTATFVETFHHINGSDQRSERSTTSWRLPASKKPTTKQLVASRVYNLSLDVAALRQQLQQLEVHRSLLQTRALYSQRDADGSAFKTTVEYWRVFRRGFCVTDPNQPAFIMSVMDKEMQIGLTGYGRHELLQQWELYTDYFSIRYFNRHSTRVIATDDASGVCVTRSEGMFSGSFTRRGLEMVFPSVLQDLDLTQQLLSTELVVPIAIVLHFNAQGAVFRQEGEADFMHALQNALGSILRAAEIVQNARLLEENMLERHRDTYNTDDPGQVLGVTLRSVKEEFKEQ